MKYLNRNSYIFIQEIVFENVIWKRARTKSDLQNARTIQTLEQNNSSGDPTISFYEIHNRSSQTLNQCRQGSMKPGTCDHQYRTQSNAATSTAQSLPQISWLYNIILSVAAGLIYWMWNDFKENVVSCWTEGALVMRGKKSGDVTRLKEDHPCLLGIRFMPYNRLELSNSFSCITNLSTPLQQDYSSSTVNVI